MKSIVFILVYILAFSVLLINSEIEFKLNGVRQLMYGQGIEKTFSNISVKGISFDEELCQLQTTYLLNQIQSTSIWAVQMFDAWGKIPSGILHGNSIDRGNFDQCLGIHHDSDVETIGSINGQYCSASMNIQDFLPSSTIQRAGMLGGLVTSSSFIHIGICIPHSCSPDYFLNISQELIGIDVALISDPTSCRNGVVEKFNAVTIAAIVFFGIIIVLLIASTTYDIMTRYYQKPQVLLFLSFSLYTNGEKLFSAKRVDSPDIMYCLNGIRVLSIVWVIFGHCFGTLLLGGVINTTYILEWIKKYRSMILVSATFSVDSFLLLSGLLVTWSVLKELDKSKKLNIPLMYLHRYLRLTPAFGALILFILGFQKYIGDGPNWNVTALLDVLCETKWWSALLYVQNYVNPDGICLGHSWYLSVDMQLFILSPIILIPLWKWGKFTIPVIIILIFGAMGINFGIFYVNEYSVKQLSSTSTDRTFKMYYATHTRFGAWLVGVLLGYILFVHRGKKVQISNTWKTIGWILSLGSIFVIVFGQYNIQQMDSEEIVLRDAFYDSCSRVGWAVALSWIIFACCKGFGGIINWFLSLAFWIPLARLSYSIYLTHYVLQILRVGSSKTAGYFSDLSIIAMVCGDVGFALAVSIFWCLAFESPIVVLENYLIPRSKKSNGLNKNKTASTESQKNYFAMDKHIEVEDQPTNIIDAQKVEIKNGNSKNASIPML